MLDLTYIADARGGVLTAAANESGCSDLLPSLSLAWWLFFTLPSSIPSWKEGQSFRRVTIVYNACPRIITELLKVFGKKQNKPNGKEWKERKTVWKN